MYMCGGFREWEVGDHVLVEYLNRAQRRAAASNSTSTCSITDAGSLAGGSLVGGASSTSMTPGGAGSIATADALGEEHDHQTASNSDGECVQSSAGHHVMPRLLPAVITNAGATCGMFDIRWDDGECERDVRRNRIHRPTSPCPPWTKIYHGEDCRYAVVGMVPETVIERERNIPYEVSMHGRHGA